MLETIEFFFQMRQLFQQDYQLSGVALRIFSDRMLIFFDCKL